ncbi:MAG: hypothetical protein ABJ024_15575 [Lentilitoribacter sp.]
MYNEPVACRKDRGEFPLKIGDVQLGIAIEFSSLSRLAQKCQIATMHELQVHLVGFHPFVAACALSVFSVHPDGIEEAQARAKAAIKKLTAADEEEWREIISLALKAHLDAGEKLRAEPQSLIDEVDAVMGEPIAVTVE